MADCYLETRTLKLARFVVKTRLRRLTLVVKEAREVEDDKSEMSRLKIPTTRRAAVLSSVAPQLAFTFVA